MCVSTPTPDLRRAGSDWARMCACTTGMWGAHRVTGVRGDKQARGREGWRQGLSGTRRSAQGLRPIIVHDARVESGPRATGEERKERHVGDTGRCRCVVGTRSRGTVEAFAPTRSDLRAFDHV